MSQTEEPYLRLRQWELILGPYISKNGNTEPQWPEDLLEEYSAEEAWEKFRSLFGWTPCVGAPPALERQVAVCDETPGIIVHGQEQQLDIDDETPGIIVPTTPPPLVRQGTVYGLDAPLRRLEERALADPPLPRQSSVLGEGNLSVARRLFPVPSEWLDASGESLEERLEEPEYSSSVQNWDSFVERE